MLAVLSSADVGMWPHEHNDDENNTTAGASAVMRLRILGPSSFERFRVELAGIERLLDTTPNRTKGEVATMSSVPPAPLPSLISTNPQPLVPGQNGEVCYDFSPLETPPDSADLRIDWIDGDGGKTSQNITVNNNGDGSGCTTVSVPSDAVAVDIVDLSGNSSAFSDVL